MNLKIILVTRPHAYINCKQFFFLKNWLKVHIPFMHSIFTLAPDLSFDCLCILDLHKKYGLFCSLVVARSILLNVKLAPEILHEAFGFWVSFCFKLLVYSVLLIKAKEIMVNKLCKNLFVCSLLEQVNHT